MVFRQKKQPPGMCDKRVPIDVSISLNLGHYRRAKSFQQKTKKGALESLFGAIVLKSGCNMVCWMHGIIQVHLCKGEGTNVDCL